MLKLLQLPLHNFHCHFNRNKDFPNRIYMSCMYHRVHINILLPDLYIKSNQLVKEQNYCWNFIIVQDTQLFFKSSPPCVQFPKYFCFSPIIFFIDKINCFFLYCCTDLKKCCPEMYAAYTESVEEQSISGIMLLF